MLLCVYMVTKTSNKALYEKKAEVIAAAGHGDVDLSLFQRPKRLDRENRYLIVGKDRVVANWKSDGHGWTLITRFGNLPAAKNRDDIPTQGEFFFVELILERTTLELNLVGIRIFQLNRQRALDAMSRNEDAICSKIVGPGHLVRQQKDAVRNAVRDWFMPAVWQDATAVLGFLGNRDFHSPGVFEEGFTPRQEDAGLGDA